ncbi:hypothetical protein, partial [Escherichia coli]|uniref:hypothetical protein n=1 Tax=Escherichia coli TaxID=562 RepID=UPI003D214AA3
MPLAAALMNLLVNLSQRFSIQYLEQLPLRQLFRLIKHLEKQHGNRYPTQHGHQDQPCREPDR